MGDVLIIRSVSFQQLDLNLPALRTVYHGQRLVLLTHAHGVKLAETYRDIAEVVVYPSDGPFTKAKVPEALKDRVFDSVVVPVTNSSGAGFFNVLELAFSFNTKEVRQCNVRSEINLVEPKDVKQRRMSHALFSLLAGMAGVLAGIVALPYLLWQLPKLEKKE